MPKILVVEDDQNIAQQVSQYLKAQSYNVEVAEDGDNALSLMRHYHFDVVVLDCNLPKMSGFDVCKNYRSHGGSARILMLTGRNSIREKEQGLDSGADDYLTKPFDSIELMARVRALLRRPAEFKAETLKNDRLIVDTKSRTVHLDGKLVKLFPGDFDLLCFFMKHPDQVFSGEALLERVWNDAKGASDMALRKSIHRLRTNLYAEIIETVYSVGYVMKTSKDQREQ